MGRGSSGGGAIVTGVGRHRLLGDGRRPVCRVACGLPLRSGSQVLPRRRLVAKEVGAEVEEPGGDRAPSLDAVLEPLPRVVLVLHRREDDEEQEELHEELVDVRLGRLRGLVREEGGERPLDDPGGNGRPF